MGENTRHTVSFPKYLIQKHQSFDTYGVLIGWKEPYESKFFIVNVISTIEDKNDFSRSKEELESCLPSGYDALGIWSSDFEMDASEWAEIVNLPTETGELIVVSGGSAELKAWLIQCYCGSWSLLSEVDVLLVDMSPDESLRKRSVSLCLKFTLNLEIQVPTEAGVLRSELLKSFEKLERRFSTANLENRNIPCKAASVVFKPNNSNLLLGCSKEYNLMPGDFVDGPNTVFDLWKLLHGDDNKPKNKSLLYMQDCINFTLLEDIMPSSGKQRGGKCEAYVPVIHYESTEFVSYIVKLPLYAIAICSQDFILQDVHRLLCQALVRQVRCSKTCMESFSNFQANRLAVPVPYLFNPYSIRHPLILCYPNSLEDEFLEKRRREICRIWNIETDRPCIKRMNRYLYPHERGVYLLNVHRYVSPSGIMNGVCASVAGDYEYRHYMQDNFNDNGWGCAYRSFQTVWSWFLLQGYVEKPVPNHKEIQQALVDIGDRPAGFVGSKQWIGSLELSYCLSHMINIESKIINISSGSELILRVRDLIAHFQTEGTPVMIGGGVLAHTILGVHYCEVSDEAKFLVLDPHYTREENIKTIVDKGWCGWKPITFWSNDAFYNLLLPQRPKNVV